MSAISVMRMAAIVLLMVGCASSKEADQGRELTHEIAEIMVSHHAYDQAIPLLQRSLANDPNSPRNHLLMGIVLRDKGLFKEARHELEWALRSEPRDIDTLTALGMLADMEGKGEEAETYHRRAIEIYPARAESYNNLGFSLYLRGRYADAVVAYRQSLEHDPGVPRVYNNLGFALARQGLYDEALRAFQQAGTKSGAWANMGLAYELGGNVTAARGCYEEALKLNRHLQVARTNLENLESAHAPTTEEP